MKRLYKSFIIIAYLLLLGAFTSTGYTQTINDDSYITNGTVYATVTDGNTVYLGGSFTEVGSYTGRGVVLNATTGIYDNTFPKVNGTIYAVVEDGSGGWYIGGDFTTVGGTTSNRLAHIKSDKTLNAVFTYGLLWGSKVKTKKPKLITKFEIPKGNIKKDDVVQVNVGVKNSTSEYRNFWVGLSFGHEYTSLDKWPIGWYDISPIQTNMLAPNEIQIVTFNITVSKTLRTGQYFAISRIWDSFNKRLYVMEGYIDGTENYPNWIDNSKLGKKSFYLHH